MGDYMNTTLRADRWPRTPGFRSWSQPPGEENAVSSPAPGGLLLLLSRFSHVRLCATPETAAHQVPPSLGLSKQEHWSGLPFPSPMHESEK